MDHTIVNIVTFIMFVVFVSGLGGLVLWKIFDLVRNSINKNESSHSEERFDRLAKAFIKHKKQMEQRMQNIEAIIADEGGGTVSSKSIDESHQKSIEIDPENRLAENVELKNSKTQNMATKKQRNQ
jgi:predicted PurR-regulated permease PerM